MEVSAPRLGGPSQLSQAAERGPGLYIPAFVIEPAQGRGFGKAAVFYGSHPAQLSAGNTPGSWGATSCTSEEGSGWPAQGPLRHH